MERNEFDYIAGTYDAVFSDSPIGKLQRHQVYTQLTKILHKLNGSKILDLGCGTGEDAIWLAQKDFLILAMDSSAEMIKVTNKKVEQVGLQSKVFCRQLSILELKQVPEEATFDLIFSNFGAFNCLSPAEIQKTVNVLHDRLESKGHFVAVVMNNFCWWESLYFLFKGSLRNAFRRRSKQGVPVPFGTGTVMTWYYNPVMFYKYFSKYFKLESVHPVGFFVPPSYLNKSHRQSGNQFLNIMGKLDYMVQNSRMASKASDHFFIHLIRK